MLCLAHLAEHNSALQCCNVSIIIVPSIIATTNKIITTIIIMTMDTIFINFLIFSISIIILIIIATVFNIIILISSRSRIIIVINIIITIISIINTPTANIIISITPSSEHSKASLKMDSESTERRRGSLCPPRTVA